MLLITTINAYIAVVESLIKISDDNTTLCGSGFRYFLSINLNKMDAASFPISNAGCTIVERDGFKNSAI